MAGSNSDRARLRRVESITEIFWQTEDVKRIIYEYCIHERLIAYREPHYNNPHARPAFLDPSTAGDFIDFTHIRAWRGVVPTEQELSTDRLFLRRETAKKIRIYLDQPAKVNLQVRWSQEACDHFRFIECTSRYKADINIACLPRLETLILGHEHYTFRTGRGASVMDALLRDEDDDKVKELAEFWISARKDKRLPYKRYCVEASQRELNSIAPVSIAPTIGRSAVPLAIVLRFWFHLSTQASGTRLDNSNGIEGVEIMYELRKGIVLSKKKCRFSFVEPEDANKVDESTLEIPRERWKKTEVIQDALAIENGIPQVNVQWGRGRLFGQLFSKVKGDSDP